MGRAFANDPGDLIIIYAALFNTQHYKVRIKDKVERSRERGVVVIKKWTLGLPLTSVANFTYSIQEKTFSSPFEIGLVSLFNDISTFVGFLMPKPFSEKNSSGTI